MKVLDKLDRLNQLATLPENLQDGFLAISNQIDGLNGKLKALYGSVKAENSKEVITYQNELKALLDAILSLQEAVSGKDMVVNIPLDNLSSQMVKVEQAIKAIKEVKIPEFPKFPTQFSLDELQINELLLAIQSLPEFPIDELKKMVDGLGKKIEAIKIEFPEQEKIDYEFFYERFKRLEKAVNGISITVSGGGSSDVVKNSAGQTINPATEETLQSIAGFELPPYDTLELTYVTAGNGIGEIATVLYKKDSVLVATLTLSYDSGNNLISVVKS